MENKLICTPFWKQVFVVLGSSINLAQISLTTGYTAILLPQLKHPDSIIEIDDNSGSWIASTIGVTQIFGNILGAAVMGKYGRRVTGLLTIGMALIGWIWIALATSITSFLLTRSLQGINMGMALSLSPISTGEYTSPRNRAAFTSMLMLTGSVGLLGVHTLGVYLLWQTTALIAAIVTFVGLIIIFYSPETPSWLADQGRYDECKEVFRWLRGENEEEELQKLIEASRITRELKNSRPSQTFTKDAATNFVKFCKLLTRREFYLPVFIMFHLYSMAYFSGIFVLAAYTEEYVHYIVGADANFGMQITLMDISRLIANAFGIYLTKIVKRKVFLTASVGTNIFCLLVLSIYAYAKLNNLLLFDHPLIGILLGHILYISILLGATTLTLTISAELFPLEFRSFAGGVTAPIYSIGFFVCIKTIPFSIKTFGMHGLLLMYGIIMIYCLIATLLVLPETKDRTLQDIEDELRGKHRDHNEKQAIPLTTLDAKAS